MRTLEEHVKIPPSAGRIPATLYRTSSPRPAYEPGAGLAVVVERYIAPLRPSSPWTIRVRCPHCGRTHQHGAAQIDAPIGHRVAHCGAGGYTIAHDEKRLRRALRKAGQL